MKRKVMIIVLNVVCSIMITTMCFIAGFFYKDMYVEYRWIPIVLVSLITGFCSLLLINKGD